MATLILDINTEIVPYLDAKDASSDDVALLELLERNVIGLVEGDTGWRFTEGDPAESLIFSGHGGTRVWLPQRAITLTTVYVRASAASAWEALDASAYELSSDKTRLLRIDGIEFPDGDDLMKVVGTFGYEADEVPNDVRQLLLEMMNWAYRRGRKTFGEQQVLARMKNETNYDAVARRYRKPFYG